MSGSPRLDRRQHVRTTQSPSRPIDSRHDARGVLHESSLGFSKAANHPESQRNTLRGPSSPERSSMLVRSSSELTPEFPLYNDSHRSSFASNAPASQGKSSSGSQHSKTSSLFQTESGGRQMSIEEAIAGQQATPRPLSASRSPSGKGSAGKERVAGVPAELSQTAERGMGRLRSKSIGSLSRESRIAALSVHLRTRLAYAAAKIEKSRQIQKAQDLPPTARIDYLLRSGHLPYPGQTDAQHAVRVSSPASTTMSSPDMHTTAGYNHPSGSARLSPAAWSEAASPHMVPSRHHHHHHHHHHQSLMDRSTRPRLAPPVDIIPMGGSSHTRRRRPNPNEFIHRPFSHRRHHSHQELDLSQSNSTHSERILVPGTPPLHASNSASSARYGGLGSEQGHSRNSTMEQDAIETLLFMSSPGHTGYHSNSQHSQRPQNVPRSSNGSQESSLRVPWGQPSHRGSTQGQSAEELTGLEAQAGDEIDRLLDQMDSDSEGDGEMDRVSGRSRQGGSSAEPSRSHKSQH